MQGHPQTTANLSHFEGLSNSFSWADSHDCWKSISNHCLFENEALCSYLVIWEHIVGIGT